MLGRGGYGAVFLAEQTSVGRTCAVKVLVPGESPNPRNQKRFEVEARATSQLNHPNTVVIYDFGIDDELGVLFIAMEHIDGESLRDVIEREGTLPVRRAVRITHQIARSLDDAHTQGVVHRDVKPHNVMVTRRGGEDDFVKVIDFGIAKVLDQQNVRKSMLQITATGMVVGTPAYMSPEQVRNDPLDHKSDQYSLAVCVYQMLTGRAVFDATSPLDIATKHITQRPLPVSSLNRALNLSAAFDDVLLRALSKSPADRFPSTRDFADALVLAANVPLQLVATGEEPRDRGGEGNTAATAPLTGVDPHGMTQDTPEHVTPMPTDPDRSDAAYADTASVERAPVPDRDEVAGHTLQVDSMDALPDVDVAVGNADGPSWSFQAPQSNDEEHSASAERGTSSRRLVVGVLLLAAVAVTGVIGAYMGTRAKDAVEPVVAPVAESEPTATGSNDPEPGGPPVGEPSEPTRSVDAGPAVDAGEQPVPAVDTVRKTEPVEAVGTRVRPPANEEKKPSGTKESVEKGAATTAKNKPVKKKTPEPDPPDRTPAPAPGRATVTIVPWGELWIDGRKRGTERRQTFTLESGQHLFELRQNGQVEARKTVDVPAGENTMIELIAR